MIPHFEEISDPKVKGNHSFVDVLHLEHPFVIVDEAHNQGTPLAFETLARFEPSAILELTAAPPTVCASRAMYHFQRGGFHPLSRRR